MIGMTGENSTGTVKLLEQHDADQLMRPSRAAKGEAELGALDEARRKAIGAADNEAHGRAVLRAPFAQEARKLRTVDVFAALVQNDDDRSGGNDVGERDRLLDTPAFGVLRTAFTNFDDFKVAKAELTSGHFRAFAIRRGELALRSLFETADGGNEKAHGATRSGKGSRQCHIPSSARLWASPTTFLGSRATSSGA